MRTFTKSMMLTCLFALTSFVVFADHLADRLLFSSRLNGTNIVPTPITSTASGVAGFMLNNSRDTLYMNFSTTGLSGAITGFHIHEGGEKDNGPVILDLFNSL